MKKRMLAVALTVMASGALAEDSAACWCCSKLDQSCQPANRSGAGRIVLAQCFP